MYNMLKESLLAGKRKLKKKCGKPRLLVSFWFSPAALLFVCQFALAFVKSSTSLRSSELCRWLADWGLKVLLNTLTGGASTRSGVGKSLKWPTGKSGFNEFMSKHGGIRWGFCIGLWSRTSIGFGTAERNLLEGGNVVNNKAECHFNWRNGPRWLTTTYSEKKY